MIRNPARTVLIAEKAGRLGNRLFLSAYFMANALARGYNLLNPALGEYACFFEGSSGDPFCRFPSDIKNIDSEFASQCRDIFLACSGVAGALLPGVTTLDIRKSIDSLDGIYDLNSADFGSLLRKSWLLCVKGWKFRDDANLIRYHAEIARYFRPLEAIQRGADDTLLKARALGGLVVGIHIRHGDYRHWKGGIHYFETDQYAHWMRELTRLYDSKPLVFLVCASDPVDISRFHGLNVVMGPGSVIGDLHALSLCDLIMAPPSTFSTWASYVGRVPLCMMQSSRQDLSLQDFALHDRV